MSWLAYRLSSSTATALVKKSSPSSFRNQTGPGLGFLPATLAFGSMSSATCPPHDRIADEIPFSRRGRISDASQAGIKRPPRRAVQRRLSAARDQYQQKCQHDELFHESNLFGTGGIHSS